MIDPAEGQPEAVGDEATEHATDPFMDIAGEMLGEEEETPAEEAEGDEPETDEAEDETEDEAEADDLPPIDPPVSWDAEAKELFKSLPREAQEVVQKREAERERFVQQKSQEATQAQRNAEQAAIQQLAQIEQGYAEQFQSLAEQLQPQRPNPALLQHDPQAFYAQQAAYEASVAQRHELQQQAQHYAQQAQVRQAQIEQAEHDQQVQIITEHFPEYADPTTGPELQRTLTAVAKELGFPQELIAQARATDILAMRKASEWKAKADQLDKLNAKKMEKVRAAKGLPKSVKPGVAVSNDQTRAARSKDAWERVKTSSGSERDAAFADYLASQGIIS